MSRVLADLNYPKIVDALNVYIDYRIEILRTELELTDPTSSNIARVQGRLSELKDFRKLRETAIAVLGEKSG